MPTHYGLRDALLGPGGAVDSLQGVASQRQGVANRRRGEEAPGSERGHRDTLNENRAGFDAKSPQAADGDVVRIFEWTISAGEGFVLGYGTVENHPDNQGNITLNTLATSTPSDMEGWLVLRSENSAGLGQSFHWRERTEEIRTTVKFPEIPMEMITEDSVIYGELVYDANASAAGDPATVDGTATSLTANVTRFPNPS